MKTIFQANQYLHASILFVGIMAALLRLALAWVNPPENAYDNHMETIEKWVQNKHRPAPFDCWECYQPPAYYWLASKVFQ